MFPLGFALWALLITKEAQAFATADDANISQQCINDTQLLIDSHTTTVPGEWPWERNQTTKLLLFKVPFDLYSFTDFLDGSKGYSNQTYECYGTVRKSCSGYLGLDCEWYVTRPCCTYDATDDTAIFQDNCTGVGGQFTDFNVTIDCLEIKLGLRRAPRFLNIPACFAASCNIEEIQNNWTKWFRVQEPFSGFKRLEQLLNADPCGHGVCVIWVCKTTFGGDGEVPWCKESLDSSSDDPPPTPPPVSTSKGSITAAPGFGLFFTSVVLAALFYTFPH